MFVTISVTDSYYNGRFNLNRQVNNWQETSIVELITLPLSDCIEILQLLESRAALLPGVRRRSPSTARAESQSNSFMNSHLYFVPFET
jgi:hypothetical protein